MFWCSSGSEAVEAGIKLARAATGRSTMRQVRKKVSPSRAARPRAMALSPGIASRSRSRLRAAASRPIAIHHAIVSIPSQSADREDHTKDDEDEGVSHDPRTFPFHSTRNVVFHA